MIRLLKRLSTELGCFSGFTIFFSHFNLFLTRFLLATEYQRISGSLEPEGPMAQGRRHSGGVPTDHRAQLHTQIHTASHTLQII